MSNDEAGKRILVCNDDGVGAPGLVVIVKALVAAGYDVRVSAPEGNCSANSHCITVREAIYCEPHKYLDEDLKGVKAIAVSGTPVDSMRMGLHLFGEEGWSPDLVVSGINKGSNTGLSAVYSGTLANAIEAAIQKQRSVAFSLVHPDTYPSADDAWPFDVVTGVALDIVARLLAVDDADYNKDVVLNVNLPNIGSVEDHKGVRIATQGRSTWSNAYEEVTAHASNTGRRAFQDVGVFALVDEGEADDTIISHQGWTAVTPLSLFWQAGRADVWEGLEAILTA